MIIGLQNKVQKLSMQNGRLVEEKKYMEIEMNLLREENKRLKIEC